MGNRPSHDVFLVDNYDKDGEAKAHWTKIGAAWPHKDGKGFSIQLKGDLQLRERKEEEEPSG